MDLNAARAYAVVQRQEFEFVSLSNRSRNQCAGNYSSKPFHRKNAINGKPRQQVCRPSRNLRSYFSELITQLIQSRSCFGAHCNNGRASRKDPATNSARFANYQRKKFFFNKICLGDYDQPSFNTEQPANIEMLARLWHHTFIGSDHQHDDIYSMSSGKHVFHKPLVAGNIDKANPHLAQIKISKSEIDSDAATLFFRQTIRIASRERPHKRALAVIDMAGSADDDVTDISGGFRVSVGSIVVCLGSPKSVPQGVKLLSKRVNLSKQVFQL